MSLKEVSNLEKILVCKSLLKENFNFWNEELGLSHAPANDDLRRFRADVCEMSVTLLEATLLPESEEVTFFVAAFVAKRLLDKHNCKNAKCVF